MNIDKILSEMSLEEKASLCSGADYWHTKALERFNIPRVMMCDASHGLRKQNGEGDHLGIKESIPAVCFPTASAMASSFDRKLLGKLGETMGEECQAEDLGMLLGPGVNIKRTPLCGRNFEYYSEDPYLAGEMAVAYVQGIQNKGVASCIKHFAANNQESRRMSGDSRVDERTLHEIYLFAFEAAVKRGKIRSVMCAYNQLNGEYCSENKTLLTEILRDKWGFEGFVVTDWGAVKDRVKGLEAGLDLEMPGGPGVQDAKIVEAVKSGAIDEEVLDKAARNMLEFVGDYMESRDTELQGKGLDFEKDRAISLEFAKECAVLLRNEGDLLPLDKTQTVAFIGEFAEKPRYQGAGSSHVNVPHATSALEAARCLPITYAQGYSIKGDRDDAALLEEAKTLAIDSDVAVLFVGLPDAYETEGADRAHMNIPENQTRLIREIAAEQPNTVVVLHGGSPITMPWVCQVSAILNMHLSGDEVGKATIALLFGDSNPSGKLAETYPRRIEDTPAYLNYPGENGVVNYREGVFVGYRYYDKRKQDVLFPFGHGLSYTSFEYSKLMLDKPSINDTEILTVSCRIKNTGTRFGKEVVQLYVGDVKSTVNRPVRELKDFAKVALDAGEEKTVSFRLDKRAFAYYEPLIHDWYVEGGEFTIEVGASSRDIRLSGAVDVTGTVTLPTNFTQFSTLGEIMVHEKGAALVRRMLNPDDDSVPKSENHHLGEGSEERISTMVMEMPLISLVTFGRMTEEQMCAFLVSLNS